MYTIEMPISIMQIVNSILSGIIVGLTLVIPLGPAGLETVRRSINYGFWVGALVGLGATTADALYLFSIHIGLLPLLEQPIIDRFFSVFSTFLLLAMGLKIFSQPPSKFNSPATGMFGSIGQEKTAFITGLAITGLNPLTITLWMSVGTTVLSYWNDINLWLGYLFTIGLLIGQALWFVFISRMAHGGFIKLSNQTMIKLQKISGIALIAFALWNGWRFLNL